MVPGASFNKVFETEIAQTLVAHRHKQREIVNINEVPKCANDNHRLQKLTHERTFGCDGWLHDR